MKEKKIGGRHEGKEERMRNRKRDTSCHCGIPPEVAERRAAVAAE